MHFLIYLRSNQQTFTKYLLLGSAVYLLLLVGFYEPLFESGFIILYQNLFAFLNLLPTFQDTSCHDCTGLTRLGSVLITFSYGILYSALCLLIIYIYFRRMNIVKMAFWIYTCLFILSVLINETGKVMDFEPFRVIAYRVMLLVVSPMLVMLIIPAMYLVFNRKEITTADPDQGPL